jgi:hypothetical protein
MRTHGEMDSKYTPFVKQEVRASDYVPDIATHYIHSSLLSSAIMPQ